MKRAMMAISLAVAMVGLSAMSVAKDRIDQGKHEFDGNCAVCHGVTGKGNGPMAGIIKQRVADLTALSKNNGGVFPLEHVYAVIEGDEVVKGHGPRDMPVWGEQYKEQATKYYSDFPRYDEAAFVRARILSVAEYVSRLQQK